MLDLLKEPPAADAGGDEQCPNPTDECLGPSIRWSVAALDLVADALFVVHARQGVIEHVNQAGCALLAGSRRDLCGRHWHRVAGTSGARRLALAQCAAPTKWRTIALRRLDGTRITVDVRWMPWHSPGAPDRVLLVCDSLGRRELLRLASRRHRDPVTGLPCRGLLRQYLARAQRRLEREGRKFVLAFADLDGFKRINDQAGHLLGDRLLRIVAARLRRTLARNDFLTRYGGDEFVAVIGIPPLAGSGTAQVAQRLEDCFRNPIALGRRSISLSASIGVAAGRLPCPPLEVLLHEADQAMYRAKETKRKFPCPTSPSDRAASSRQPDIACSASTSTP